MMTSLCSIFDPNGIFSNSMWVIIVMMFLIFISFYNSIWNMDLMKNVIKKINLDFFSYPIFMFILILNLMGLMPYVFAGTSHMSFNLTLALSMWLSGMIYYMYYNLYSFFSHLTPMGCPMLLVPFMVIVELISSLIRPLSLSLRLTANIVAGHMIMNLIGLMINLNIYSSLVSTILLLGFTMFEVGVAFIQAYVFFTLMKLYWMESK